MTCPHGYSDGAYVLGALCPAERSAYEAHLTECVPCATAVSHLAVLPGLLGRITEEAIRPVAPQPARLSRLIESVASLRRRHGRRRRWQFAVALAGVALLAVGGTTALRGSPEPTPTLVAMEPVAETLVSAEVGLGEVAGGTKVWMVCRYPEAGYAWPARTFRLFAVGSDGVSEQVASWRAGPGDEVALTGLVQVPAAGLERLELRAADGATLLVLTMP